MRSHLICALSGAATGLCLLFPEIGPASFFLMVPALSVQSAAGGRRRFSLCHSFCLALAAAGYAPVFSLRPDLSPALIFWADLLVYLTGCLIHSTLLALFLWAGWRFPCGEDLRWAALSLCWAVGEWLLGVGPLAWPTLRLSLALWRYPMFLSAAPLGGQLLVSAGIVAVNALLADLLCRKRKAAAWLTAIFMAAQPLLFFLPRTPSSDFFSASLVQPGGTTTGKEFAAIEERAVRLVQIAAEASPQLILLPENVILADLSQDGVCRSRWQSLARQCGIPILLGGQRQGRAAAFLLGADGQLKALRIKSREVPFFENGVQGRPFRLLPPIAPTTLPADPGPVGAFLCYESFFSSLCRRAAREDAAFLAVLTNDSWFFSQQAKELHLAAAVFRAAETGRSVLQAGLNGCTAVIDRRGQVIAQLKGEEAGILTVQIPVEEGGTLYLLWGDLWLPLALILLTAAGRKSVRQQGRRLFTPRGRMCYTIKKRKKERGR